MVFKINKINIQRKYSKTEKNGIESRKAVTERTQPTLRDGRDVSDKYDAQKWHEINWKETYEKVAGWQDKIVTQSENANRRSQLYNLQRQFMTSFEARAVAVRRVITNSGGKTPGVDKKILRSPNEYYKAILELGDIIRNPNRYRAEPLRRVDIPKPNGSTRPLGIPTIRDRMVQALYQMAVDPVVEQQSDRNSFGFRRERSTHDAVNHFRNYMDKARSPRWVLEANITKCFDRIDHGYLIKHTPICDKQVLREWLKAGVLAGNKMEATEQGTPQGGTISPMLCNVSLNGLEEHIKSKFPPKTSKVKVMRYTDDIVVTAESREDLEEIRLILGEFLSIRGLELNEMKTRITNIEDGIDLLGFNIIRKEWKSGLNRRNQQKDVLIVRPSRKSIDNIIMKIRDAFRKSKKLIEIIIKLNPIIRGWTEHKRISWHSAESFQKLNQYLWERIKKKFVKRERGRSSMRKNYSRIRRRGVGFGDRKGRTLFDPAKVKTRRINMKRLDLNPYLLENEPYFRKHREMRLMSALREKLFKKYKQTCTVCGQSLCGSEKVEIHHIKPRKEGGSNDIRNLQPLHRICHIAITHKT